MVLAISPTPIPSSQTLTLTNPHHNHLLSYLNDCNSMLQLKQIHAQAIRSIFPNNQDSIFLYSRILHFSALNDIHYAYRVFHVIENPNSFMWNTLIRACARSSDRKEQAFSMYKRMLEEGARLPDKHTFPFVLKACAYLFSLNEGQQAHAQLVKLGFESDVYVNNSLIHFYGSCGCLDSARDVFDKMTERSVVSWNSMIDALVRCGEYDTALELFVQFQDLFEPDGYTIQSVLNACAGLCALYLGMWVHAYFLRKFDDDMNMNVLVNNCLVDMYSKCGSLDIAVQVFERMNRHDLTSWNSMILGFAMHGKASLALEYFRRMIKTGKILPNSITFIGVLSACNHGCLVAEGRKYFEMMVVEYKIEPKLEHYGCLVDILARAGLIDEALDLVSSMPIKPDAVIWRSLLDSCCKKNASVELSEEMARQVIESREGDSSGAYVLLSRVYASAARWNDVGMIRKLMSDRGVRKEPGCSLIEIDGCSHEFFAGDTTHPCTNEIYELLDVIEERLDLMGYTPDISQAPMIDEVNDGKQQTLKVHSERLAIALGLLSLKPGVPLRIFKNLQICNDCHQVTKLISKMFNVEIIMRDRVRFHHFKDGSCSCMDYW
ncbi:Tetratricopeptide repeat (TPR)-like superfamily protein [Euphorbia peplus]|nr:Tetratricopeptide repeat (TPR)-like superfamily protein [Euphorbia peplus]